MLAPQLLRRDLEGVTSALAKRGFALNTETFAALEKERRKVQTETEELRSERNKRSRLIGVAKQQGEDIASLKEAVSGLGERLRRLEARLVKVSLDLENFSLLIPNLPDESVPQGNSELENEEIRYWGSPREFNFEIRDHVELGQKLNGIDFDTASRLSGSRFVVLKGAVARLHRALTQFMLDFHTERKGYVEVNVPNLVNEQALIGTGQLPKFKEDLFEIKNGDYFLIPTAEVPVTNLVQGKILEPEDLPARFVCHSPCFRSEAGSYGKDTRGMIRQHQFEKVELVQIVNPDISMECLEELTQDAEDILKNLGLPYRVVNLCSGDLGFSSAKTYDLEVWLPSEECYREISSCSNFRDFQAMRLRVRWRNPDSGKPEFVHTLNGSGLAVGRTLVALIENYQLEDGCIEIPKPLQRYMGGEQVLSVFVR